MIYEASRTSDEACGFVYLLASYIHTPFALTYTARFDLLIYMQDFARPFIPNSLPGWRAGCLQNKACHFTLSGAITGEFITYAMASPSRPVITASISYFLHPGYTFKPPSHVGHM